MRSILFTLMVAFTTIVFAQGTYTIKGTLLNQGNEKITIMYFDGAKNVTNEVVADNGKFTLSGAAPEKPVVARLNSTYDRNTYFGENKTSMYMPAPPLEIVLSQGATIEISGEVKNLHMATVTGDKYNDAFTKFRKGNEADVKKMAELQSYMIESRKMGVTDGLKEISMQMVETRKKLIENQKSFITGNPNELVSAYMLGMLAKEYNLTELKTAYAALSPELQQSIYGQNVKQRIDIVSQTESGKAAPGFSKPGIDGQPIQLSQFKGKYLLLDFWGSWCAPCRASNPHLKELYAKYKDKGFEILGIACEKLPNLTDAVNSWKKAVTADGITWPQVINNEEPMKTNLIQLYGIDGYPTKILIDNNGNIIARWLGAQGNELDVKLKEIFKF